MKRSYYFKLISLVLKDWWKGYKEDSVDLIKCCGKFRAPGIIDIPIRAITFPFLAFFGAIVLGIWNVVQNFKAARKIVKDQNLIDSIKKLQVLAEYVLRRSFTDTTKIYDLERFIKICEETLGELKAGRKTVRVLDKFEWELDRVRGYIEGEIE